MQIEKKEQCIFLELIYLHFSMCYSFKHPASMEKQLLICQNSSMLLFSSLT